MDTFWYWTAPVKTLSTSPTLPHPNHLKKKLSVNTIPDAIWFDFTWPSSENVKFWPLLKQPQV